MHFTYHKIGYGIQVGINKVSIEQFRKHLKFLANQKLDNNFYINFDDGYECIYKNAFPYLLEYKISNIIFPVIGYIGKYNTWDINFLINKERHMNVEQIQEMSRHGSVFGSHGMNHIPITLMTKLEFEDDLKKSKLILENITNKEVRHFCPPFGSIREEHIESILKFGYTQIMIQTTPYTVKLKKKNPNVICLTNSIYKIDSTYSLNRKLRNNKLEGIKEQFIHSCSVGTIIVNSLLRRYN